MVHAQTLSTSHLHNNNRSNLKLQGQLQFNNNQKRAGKEQREHLHSIHRRGHSPLSSRHMVVQIEVLLYHRRDNRCHQLDSQ